MPIIPIRGAGEIGVVADLLPYDVPFNAWHNARNVRFKNKTISRTSVFKRFHTLIPFSDNPACVVDASAQGSQGCLVSVQSNGVFRQLLAGSTSVVSPTVAWTPSQSRFVSTRLGGVTYINNEDNRPVFRASPSAPLFAYLPGWGANDYCVSLRAYKDFLVALNVTKGANTFENMVKWSDAAQNGAPPTNWDTASPSSLAGETVLNDARGNLRDARTLGNSLILYGSQETYRMSFIGAPFVFDFEKIFDDMGVQSQDCVVEVDGKHYVFGRDAIYVHDGMSKIAISDSRVNQRIFTRLDQSKGDRCFTFLNKVTSEIVFCYPSNSDDCAWPLSEVSGCNEGVVYNYADNTWSFIDLPSVVSAGVASIANVVLWSDLGNWNTLGNSWRAFESSAPEVSVLVSTGNAAEGSPRGLYFFDAYLDGLINNPVETTALFPGFAETSVKDSDDFSASLNSTKMVRSVSPQVSSLLTGSSMNIKVGAARNPNSNVFWSNPVVFNPFSDDKADFRVAGRYLLVRFDLPSGSDIEISGYDIDIEVLAQR